VHLSADAASLAAAGARFTPLGAGRVARGRRSARLSRPDRW
jgi:hypothetical protein